MRRLHVRHTTLYRYANPVTFGEHRMLLRPRDSHDLRLLSATLVIEPHAEVRWLHDVLGNSVALATFPHAATELRIVSELHVEHHGISGPSVEVSPFAAELPFVYEPQEIPDLGRCHERQTEDSEHAVDAWAKRFLEPSRATLDVIVAMTKAIQQELVYERRDEEGTRLPTETLSLGRGACRDFALLLMEACRSLGLGARFVSGYLHDELSDGVGGGATHAWVQVYVPGPGWVELDPTNGLVGGNRLIRVAVTREPGRAVPISGAWVGSRSDYLGMQVDVVVRTLQGRRRAAP